MTPSKIAVKITLDALCRFAENYQASTSRREQLRTDMSAYEFLSYCGYRQEEAERFTANYQRMKEE